MLGEHIFHVYTCGHATSTYQPKGVGQANPGCPSQSSAWAAETCCGCTPWPWGTCQGCRWAQATCAAVSWSTCIHMSKVHCCQRVPIIKACLGRGIMPCQQTHLSVLAPIFSLSISVVNPSGLLSPSFSHTASRLALSCLPESYVTRSSCCLVLLLHLLKTSCLGLGF
jgi:hypothetical protein